MKSSNYAAPKSVTRFASASRVGFACVVRGIVALCFIGTISSHAATTITKANNTNDLNLTGSWVGGVVPGSSNVVLIDSTLTAGKTAALGGNLTIAGIQETTAGGVLTISATAGAYLTLGSSGIDMSSAAKNLNIAAEVNLGADQTWNVATSRTLTVSGDLSTTSGNLTLAGAGTITVSGNISGAGNVTKTGTGSSTLSGTSDTTMTGTVDIQGGTLSVSGSNAIGDYSKVVVESGGTLAVTASETVGSLEGAGNVTLSNGKILSAGGNNVDTHFSGNIGGGSATSGLTKVGNATLTLNGTNAYTGITNVQGGTLQVDLSNGNNVLVTTSKLTLGGGTFKVSGNNSVSSAQTLGNPTFTADTGSSIVVTASGGPSTTLTLGNTWTRSAANGSTVNIDLSAANSFLTSSPTLTNNVLGYATVTDATGTGFATVTSGNIARYTGASTLVTNSNSSSTNYSTSGAIVMTNANRSVNSLAIDTSSASGSLDLGGGSNILTITSGGLLMTGSNGYTVSDGQVGANNKEVIVHQMSTGTLTISANVGSGSGALTKDGSGQLKLTANNVFTGATVISGGKLEVASGSNQALGSTSGITVNTGGTLLWSSDNQINNSATIILNGGTLSTSGHTEGTSTTAGMGTLTLSFNSTIDLGSSSSSVVAFADSSAATWGSTASLSITNWDGSLNGGGAEQIYFGTTSNSLTAAQVGQVIFINPSGYTGSYGAKLTDGGELVAVVPAPEPSTYLAGALLASLVIASEYRRRKQLS